MKSGQADAAGPRQNYFTNFCFLDAAHSSGGAENNPAGVVCTYCCIRRRAPPHLFLEPVPGHRGAPADAEIPQGYLHSTIQCATGTYVQPAESRPRANLPANRSPGISPRDVICTSCQAGDVEGKRKQAQSCSVQYHTVPRNIHIHTYMLQCKDGFRATGNLITQKASRRPVNAETLGFVKGVSVAMRAHCV